MLMARTADTNRRKTASRRRVIPSIREKYEPKIARTANQKLKGSGVGIFSFSCGNFFIPEPKRKSSRTTFLGVENRRFYERDVSKVSMMTSEAVAPRGGSK